MIVTDHELKTIPAKWAAPSRVHAVTTLRGGGYSKGPYAGLNTASHVGDEPGSVASNEQLLVRVLKLSGPVHWLTQVHGNKVVSADTLTGPIEADGAVTERAHVVCAVLTADCVPLFLCDRAGERVGIVHVGWRGLAAGIVANGVHALAVDPADVLAWMGPAIGPDAFEVGEDVYHALATDAESAAAFRALPDGKWMADLYRLVALRLRRQGVKQTAYDKSLCTYSQPDMFYSYRRDGRCGRMASLIWKVY